MQVVREKLLCHAVVGRQYEKEVIMTSDVTCQFVSPAVDISSQQVCFYVEKVCVVCARVYVSTLHNNTQNNQLYCVKGAYVIQT